MTSAPRNPKPSVDPVRWQPPPVATLPEFGPAELTVVPMPGDAPEDIVVDADGALWTGLVDGRIVRIGPDGTVRVVGQTTGRPLGMTVARDGRLLICTSPGGLLAMDRTTLSRNLSPLLKKGWIKVSVGADRRAHPVRITPKGKTILERALPLWEQAQTQIVNRLGASNWDQIMRGLHQISMLVEENN